MSNKSQQQSNGGGCLLRLIGYGIIISTILSFILPSFINDAYKGKQSEAKTYVGSMNRQQQAYFLEKNTFTNDIEKLGLGIKTETVNYSYSTRATKKAVFNYGVSKAKYRTEYILFIPRRVKEELNSYIGGVFLVPDTEVNPNGTKDKITTAAILCETNSFSTTKPVEPTYKNGVLACGKGTTNLSR